MRANNAMPALDASIPAASLALLGIGVAAIYSVSLVKNAGWTEKQIMWAVLSLAAGCLAAKCSLSSMRRYAGPLMLAVIAGLGAVFLFEGRNGAHRWISVYGLSMQPSEFCKWAALLLAAHYGSRPQYRRRQMALVMPVMVWFAVPLVLIALQPDFGATVLILFAALVVLFISGLDLRPLLVLALLSAAVAAWLVWLEPYRMQRLAGFLDPFESASGYNQRQAMVALMSGGFLGEGVMRSVQKWGYLPEPHNDFIIAIIGEETGLAGFLLVCGLFALIIGRAVKIGNAAESRGEIFGALYAFGFAAILTAQVFINIGGNFSLLPFKGFTLPLVSYGGSSLLATGLMLGVLMRVDYENRQDLRLPREARE